MVTYRTHSIEFKRQVVQEFLSGETLHGLARRHELPRNLIRIWVQKYEADSFDEDVAAADTMQTYEPRIAALERLVGRQALEIEFLKGALKSAPRPRSGTISVITGPAVARTTIKGEPSTAAPYSTVPSVAVSTRLPAFRAMNSSPTPWPPVPVERDCRRN
ncbi:transposase [Mesorhizobium sp. LNHC209A00]|uniref:transposase n=1 Tax=Mesorhizobium sp. LNHC209A00 TaxID=1287226 RepID=UPI0003CFF244|nr:transposase IS3 [Mesorhizobium sp. LNHC209A00]